MADSKKKEIKWTSEYLESFANQYVRCKSLWKQQKYYEGSNYKCECDMLQGTMGLYYLNIYRLHFRFNSKITGIAVKAKRNKKNPFLYLKFAPRWVRIMEGHDEILQEIYNNIKESKDSKGVLSGWVLVSVLGWVDKLVCELQLLRSLDDDAFLAAAGALACKHHVTFTLHQLHVMWQACSVLMLERLRAWEAGQGRALCNRDVALLQCLLMYTDAPVDLQSDASGADGDVCERTLEVVSRYGLEEGLSGASCGGPGASCRGLWLRALRDYCGSGPVMPLVLLQRRWHEMKRRARDNFIQFYMNARATPPSKLHVDIITRYPHVVSQPLPRWKELVSRGLVYDVPMDVASEELKELSAADPLTNNTNSNIDATIPIDIHNEIDENEVEHLDSNIISHRYIVSSLTKANEAQGKNASKLVQNVIKMEPASRRADEKFSNEIEKGQAVDTIQLLKSIDPYQVQTTVLFESDDNSADEFFNSNDVATPGGNETITNHDKATTSHEIKEVGFEMEADSHNAEKKQEDANTAGSGGNSKLVKDKSFNKSVLHLSEKLESYIQKFSVDELAAIIAANISNDDVAKIKPRDEIVDDKCLSENSDEHKDAVVDKDKRGSEDLVNSENVLKDSLAVQSPAGDVNNAEGSCADEDVGDDNQGDDMEIDPKLIMLSRVNVIDIVEHSTEAIHDDVTRYCRKHGVTFDVDMLKRQLSLLCKPLAVSVERLETMERRDRKRKRVELSDIEEVRRINSNILTAQVAPITSHGCHKSKTSVVSGASSSSSASTSSSPAENAIDPQPDISVICLEKNKVLEILESLKKVGKSERKQYCCLARRHVVISENRRKLLQGMIYSTPEVAIHGSCRECVCCCRSLLVSDSQRALQAYKQIFTELHLRYSHNTTHVHGQNLQSNPLKRKDGGMYRKSARVKRKKGKTEEKDDVLQEKATNADGMEEWIRQKNLVAKVYGVKPRQKPEPEPVNKTVLPVLRVTSGNSVQKVQTAVTNEKSKKANAVIESNAVNENFVVNSKLLPKLFKLDTKTTRKAANNGEKVTNSGDITSISLVKSNTSMLDKKGHTFQMITLKRFDSLRPPPQVLLPPVLNAVIVDNNFGKIPDSLHNPNEITTRQHASTSIDVSSSHNTEKIYLNFDVPLHSTSTGVTIVAAPDVRRDYSNDNDDIASQVDDRRATLTDTHTVITPVITNVTSIPDGEIIEIDSD